MSNKIITFNKSEQGYNHIKSNPPKVCEDYSACFSDNDLGLYIIVVADGHGSDDCPRSNFGSEFAVEVTIECIKEFIKNTNIDSLKKDTDNHYILLNQLTKSILSEWYKKIYEHHKQNSFNDKELSLVSDKYKNKFLNNEKIEKAYGSTLIAFVNFDSISFGIQIGDGKCIAVNRYGEFYEPIPSDEKCQLNVTTSICDTNAIEEFRYFISDDIPIAVFCGSDGIEDSYINIDEVCALYRMILEIYIEDGVEIGNQEIVEYLPKLSKRGSGDDISLALIINLDYSCKVIERLKVDTEIFNIIDKKNRAQEEIQNLLFRKECLVKQVGLYFKHEIEGINSGKLFVDNNNISDDTIIQIKEINDSLKNIKKDIDDYDLMLEEIQVKRDEMTFSLEEIVEIEIADNDNLNVSDKDLI